ncbi:hypothetical protein LCGC14_0220870 [marine sediment metagenome]|uniref:Uncharacterized protein n=1 Tax=marine sediment metagenome TaxID=412755 RepID=A0A0F9UHR8_9ZZZZ
MSLASWKKEFYRTPANRVSKGWAMRHSIDKWTGLLCRNRRKHKVNLDEGVLYDNNNDSQQLGIDRHSCALCHHHQKNGCTTCPVKRTGKTCHTTYWDMVNDKKVAPMIRLLKKASDKPKS